VINFFVALSPNSKL